MAEMIPPRNYRWTGAGFEVRAYEKRPIVENPWRPCPRCWGQREEWAQGDKGGWYRRPCVVCFGIGDVPSTEVTR